MSTDMFDLDAEGGMQRAALWMRNLVAMIADGGMWGIPSSGSAYRFDKQKRVALCVMGGDAPTERVLEHIGWRIRYENAAPDPVVTDYPAVPFSREDNERAFAEGWGLFETTVGPWEVQRIDAPEDGSEPRFQSDAHAIAHVYWLANEGSPLHRKAMLASLGITEDPKEGA